MAFDERCGVRLDAFDFTIDRVHLGDLISMLGDCFGSLGDAAACKTNRRYNWSRRFVGSGGIFWHESPDGSSDVPEVFGSLKGEVLGQAGPDVQFEFFRAIEEWSDPLAPCYKPTHFDVAFDDWSWLKTPAQIWEEYACDYCFGPFQHRLLIAGGASDDEDGYTINFGKRGRWGSGSQLCIYDKNVKSKGVINACRYEARFFGDKAVESWSSVIRGCTSVESFNVGLGKLLGGAIKFWTPESMKHTHTERRVIAPFWQAIVDHLGAARFGPAAEPPKDLAEHKESLMGYCQMIGTICEAIDKAEGAGAGMKFLSDVCWAGRQKKNKKWQKFLSSVPEKTLVEVQGALPF